MRGVCIDMKEVRCASLSCKERHGRGQWAWVVGTHRLPWFCSPACADSFQQEQLIELMAHQEEGECDCPACKPVIIVRKEEEC